VSFTKRTANTFPELNHVCADSLSAMWIIEKQLRDAVTTNWGSKELPPYQQFVSIYFFRNLVYLQGAYLLACEGSCGPSRDLQRTAYEMIMRSYLFIADKKEATLMYSHVEGDAKSRDILRKRKFYPIEPLISKMYSPASKKAHKKLFGELSRFSHPTIQGAILDLNYNAENVKDCLNMILALTYSAIQVLSEGFYNLLTQQLKVTVKETMERIADVLKFVPVIEPDKKGFSSTIRLRKGNFLKIL
jgi:hypothetical protein